MAKEQDKLKRWRPRFSLRTLVILITLVCCYAACWGPTKRQGVRDVKSISGPFPAEALAPLIIAAETYEEVSIIKRHPSVIGGARLQRHYFWFFGFVAKLPYERELPEPYWIETPSLIRGYP